MCRAVPFRYVILASQQQWDKNGAIMTVLISKVIKLRWERPCLQPPRLGTRLKYPGFSTVLSQ